MVLSSADAFTVCDAYHCSLMGPTDPNRYHLWTGWTGNDGQNGGPVLSNAELGYDWHTFPERLQDAGISWKVYQDVGDGLVAPNWGWTSEPDFGAYIGNYGDNSLLYFHQYQNAPTGSPLAIGAKTGTNIKSLGNDITRLFDIFRQDVQSGHLPRVSWIVAPEAFTEHPNWAPDFGAWYTLQMIDILTSNPDVFGKTALFINYDEAGGFFDHVVPPIWSERFFPSVQRAHRRRSREPVDQAHIRRGPRRPPDDRDECRNLHCACQRPGQIQR